MADEFDDLKAAFDAATPLPDPLKKRDNIALAEKNFASLQESRTEPRPTLHKGRMSRLRNGVTTMIHAMTTKGGLVATTALVAVGAFLVTPQGRNLLAPPTPETVLLDAAPAPASNAALEELAAKQSANDSTGASAGRG